MENELNLLLSETENTKDILGLYDYVFNKSIYPEYFIR